MASIIRQNQHLQVMILSDNRRRVPVLENLEARRQAEGRRKENPRAPLPMRKNERETSRREVPRLQQTQRSNEEAMSNEQQGEGHGPFFFGAESGNHGHFTVEMFWSNPPTDADTQEIRGWFRALTIPEQGPPSPRPAPGNGRLSQLEPDPAGELERIPDRGGAMERPYQIDIDARHSVIHQPEEKAQRRATCGNCGVKYEITEDPEENHHRAMRHKLTCGKGDVDQYSGPQLAALLEDFHNQPMQVEFRRRAAAELEAGADPDRLRLTGVSIFTEAPQPARPQIEAAGPELYPGNVDELIAAVTAPRRWWHFWRWFRSAD